jgi:XTP/dITP diphosphohydrolase
VSTDIRPVELLLASRNARKLAEMQRILGPLVPGIKVLGLDDTVPYEEPVEDRPTFEGNALLKARAGLAASGLPTVADDSGLCVDALNGMPGVLSARWSGRPKDDERNNRLLLEQLEDVPDGRRGAHFACAVAFCHPDGTELVVEGRMDGRIIREQRGSGGFGYDVVFVAVEHDDPELTSAELDAGAKDAVSHRGRALRAIAPQIARALAGPERG